MRLFTTLGARLVLTAVSLVAVVSLLIGTTTTIVMRDYLTDQLDQKVQAARRAGRRSAPGRRADGASAARRPRQPGAGHGRGAARHHEDPGAVMLTERRSDTELLTPDALEALEDVGADGDVHEVDVPGLRRRTARSPSTPRSAGWCSGCPPRTSTRPWPRW